MNEMIKVDEWNDLNFNWNDYIDIDCLELISFIFIIFLKMITKKEVKTEVEKRKNEMIKVQYKKVFVDSVYDISNELQLNFDLDYVDSGADNYVQATVYIHNLIWNWAWYNVILDVDFQTDYDTVDDVVDEIMRIETEARNMIEKFKTHTLIKSLHTN